MKKFGKPILAGLVGALVLYLALWGYIYIEVPRRVEKMYADATRAGLVLKLDPVKLGGFPGTPVLSTSGLIQNGPWAVAFPALQVRGFAVPGLNLTASWPLGLTVMGFGPQQSVDFLSVTFAVPWQLPSDVTRVSMHEWQQRGGRFYVPDIQFRSGGLTAAGKGEAALDATLQPSASLMVSVRGFENIPRNLQKQGTLTSGQAAAAGFVLSGLSRPDPETGEKVVSTTVSISNGLLWLGPLQVARLPEIQWDTRNPPAPPR